MVHVLDADIGSDAVDAELVPHGTPGIYQFPDLSYHAGGHSVVFGVRIPTPHVIRCVAAHDDCATVWTHGSGRDKPPLTVTTEEVTDVKPVTME